MSTPTLPRRPSPVGGQSLVEAAMVALLFFALAISVLDLGFILFAQQSLAERLRGAARLGAVEQLNLEEIRNAVLYGSPVPAAGSMPWLGLRPEDVAVELEDSGPAPPRLMVTIAGQSYRPLSPFLPRWLGGFPLRVWLPLESP